MKNVLLFFVALALVVTLTPLAFMVKVSKGFGLMRFDWAWFRRLAYSLDQLGNVIADDMFNWMLIKADEPDSFGNPDETISSVLGKNERAGNLTILGVWLKTILHWFDENHSIKSIEEDE